MGRDRHYVPEELQEEYWQYIPEVLQEDFINQRVVPIVGSGFSKNADIPSGTVMPDWNELGIIVSSCMKDNNYVDAIKALSAYQSKYSRAKLIKLLIKKLHIFEIKPGPAHRAFCKVFHGTTIYTTNFDFLLEQALQECGFPAYIIDSKENLTIDVAGYTRLVKLHGDFSRLGNLVITEKDYDFMLSKMKDPLSVINDAVHRFLTNTLFLVGYSMEDNDIRMLWRIMNEELKQYEQYAYCVMVDADCDEIRRFKDRNVNVINLPGKKEDYPKILEKFFFEISEHLFRESNGNVCGGRKKTPTDYEVRSYWNINHDAKYRKTTEMSMDEYTSMESGTAFSFTIKRTKKLIVIDKEDFIIGSAHECDCCIEGNRLVSGKHAVISVDFEKAKAYIFDLNSTNHTYYKSCKIQERIELKDGDEIAFATEKIVFHISKK